MLASVSINVSQTISLTNIVTPINTGHTEGVLPNVSMFYKKLIERNMPLSSPVMVLERVLRIYTNID